MTAGKERVIDMVRKLKAKAESAAQIGNAEEASAFAAKVQELLTKHKLEMSEVDAASLDEDDPMSAAHVSSDTLDPVSKREHKRVAWIEHLSSAVARAHFCENALMPNPRTKSAGYVFVGRQSDVAVAAWVFVTLVRAGFRGSHAAYTRAKRAGEDTEGFFSAYQMGYVVSIAARYDAKEQELAKAAGGKGLVPLKRAREDAAKAAEQMFKMEDVKGAPSRRSGNGGAFAAGLDDGAKAAIDGRAVKPGAQGPEPRGIKAAPKLLSKGGA